MRGQEIEIIVHTPENLPAIFCAENIKGFWIEKMLGKMRESGLTGQEWKELFGHGRTRE